VRSEGELREGRYWRQVTEYLFLKPGGNINSPLGGKSGVNIATISHSMLIAGESHLMLLEMNGSPHSSEGNYLAFIQCRKCLFLNL
jgi:hypothetical protein